MSRSPPPRAPKRLKVDRSSSPIEGPGESAVDGNDSSRPTPAKSIDSDTHSDDGEHCIICLQLIVDRTVLPSCAHDSFCFECVTIWTGQSRKCPLCTSAIGPYLIHNVRSQYDFQKHYLPPLRTSPPLQPPSQSRDNPRQRHSQRVPEVHWGRSSAAEQVEQDELERAIEKRKWVYRHNLYAKHVASNTYTRYKPHPTPAQFSASQDTVSRTTTFVRRELQVWVNLDVEFLTTFVISLMKSIDIRSETAVKLIAEFLDFGTPYTATGRKTNAEHFAHEVYCYLRSPYRNLTVYDSVVQYDIPSNAPDAPPLRERHDRWTSRRSRSPVRRRGREDSVDPLEHSPRSALSAHSPGSAPEAEHPQRILDNSRNSGRQRGASGNNNAHNRSEAFRGSSPPHRERSTRSQNRHDRSRSPRGSRVDGETRKGKEKAKDEYNSTKETRAGPSLRPLSRSPSSDSAHHHASRRLSPPHEYHSTRESERSEETRKSDSPKSLLQEGPVVDATSPILEHLSTSLPPQSPIDQSIIAASPLEKGISIKGASLGLRGSHLGISIKGIASSHQKNLTYSEDSTPLSTPTGVETPDKDGGHACVSQWSQKPADQVMAETHNTVASVLTQTNEALRKRRNLLPASGVSRNPPDPLANPEFKKEGMKEEERRLLVDSVGIANTPIARLEDNQRHDLQVGETHTPASRATDSRARIFRPMAGADSDALEATFRTKARLRVRLAAERRLNEEKDTSPGDRDMAASESIQGDALHSPHLEHKEATLRDQLFRRKASIHQT